MTIPFSPSKASATLASLVVTVALTAPVASYAAPVTGSPAPMAARCSDDETNSYVRGLNYKPEDVLKHDGEKITNPPKSEGEMKDGVFRVITKNRRTISNKSTDIAATNSTASTIYPGALLLGDKNFVENQPTLVNMDRKPLTMSVNLPGMDGKSNSESVKNPTRSDTNGALNTLLERWNKDYAPKYPNPPATMQYEETMAYTQDQLIAKFGVGSAIPITKLGVDFTGIREGKKQTSVVSFKQIFYTASVNDPGAPSDMIANSVCGKGLKERGINASAPPVYVSSVSYGRQMYVKLETSSTSSKVEAAFKAIVKGVDISGNIEYQKIIANSNFRAIVLGGSSKGQSEVVTGKLADLKKVINADANYSRTNPGVPISYTAKFLKDNAQAAVHNNSEYVETKVTTYRNGKLNLAHKGGYVARFKVGWDEIAYENGEEKKTHKEWDGNGKDRTAPFNTVIPLPANARNITVFAEEATGLAWEPWRTVRDDKDLPLAKERNIAIWGTTLHPKSDNKVPEDKHEDD
ncbi:thiol-activated cytolysin family protein [Austwickia chelonae]|uniref:thiol-activated cytolysin family protein n=1 Tax=Austwickia chelonae TaxID=100225 RepID=UPI000E22C95A|nr:thiol-activated cytolysin family protein [Austwickia chelonae]